MEGNWGKIKQMLFFQIVLFFFFLLLSLWKRGNNQPLCFVTVNTHPTALNICITVKVKYIHFTWKDAHCDIVTATINNLYYVKVLRSDFTLCCCALLSELTIFVEPTTRVAFVSIKSKELIYVMIKTNEITSRWSAHCVVNLTAESCVWAKLWHKFAMRFFICAGNYHLNLCNLLPRHPSLMGVCEPFSFSLAEEPSSAPRLF